MGDTGPTVEFTKHGGWDGWGRRETAGHIASGAIENSNGKDQPGPGRHQ